MFKISDKTNKFSLFLLWRLLLIGT